MGSVFKLGQTEAFILGFSMLGKDTTMGGSFSRMEIFMRESGHKGKPMDTENTFTKTALFTRENSRMTNKRARAKKCGKMGVSILGILRIVLNGALVALFGRMAQCTREISSEISSTAEVSSKINVCF